MWLGIHRRWKLTIVSNGCGGQVCQAPRGIKNNEYYFSKMNLELRHEFDFLHVVMLT